MEETLKNNEDAKLVIPSFEEWLNKYFETPKIKMMYKRKDGKGEYDRKKLMRNYKRTFRLSI